MHTLAETQVWVGLSSDVELVGTVEHAGITVGRAFPDLHLLSRLHRRTADCDTAGGSTPLGRRRRRPSDDLLDRGRQRIEILTQRPDCNTLPTAVEEIVRW